MGICICSTERLWHSVMHVKHLNCLSEDETHICMFLLESHNAKYNIEIVCCNTCNNQYVTNKYNFSFTIWVFELTNLQSLHSMDFQYIFFSNSDEKHQAKFLPNYVISE